VTDAGASAGRRLQAIAQVALGAVLVIAGIGHLTTLRDEFQAQVPGWVPGDADVVVVVSGVVELVLGAALWVVWHQPARAVVGGVVAVFFVVIFPGNVAQFVDGVDAFGLDSDVARGVRLLFQPVLVVWALVATDAVRVARERWVERSRD
jgi:uncharacterized membrane protein